MIVLRRIEYSPESTATDKINEIYEDLEAEEVLKDENATHVGRIYLTTITEEEQDESECDNKALGYRTSAGYQLSAS